ncbi:MAG: hypothetical protein F6K42_39335, partial [Leptolyngbya sp. SIO1D8]|nr:hypothetical protein [Leptolyngbya sp. SIO1D8]
ENQFGSSVASGDVNGDGIDDVLIGANGYGYEYYPGGYASLLGEIYVLFGKDTGFSDIIPDSTLRKGEGGWFFEAAESVPGDYDYLGDAITSADINGDGIDDIITGTAYAYQDSGAVYIVFGFDDPSVNKFELSSLDGDNGFVIRERNRIGKTVAVVDLDGDGHLEIISGENTTDTGVTGTGAEQGKEGEVTVFFNTINQTITGNEGFRMLSAPTHGAVFNELLAPFWTQGFAGSDGPTADSANAWIWDTETQEWTELTNQTSDSLLAAGTGFLFHIYEDDNFGGPGNTGFPKRMSVSQFGGSGTFNSGTINPVSDLADGNFFFAGNPFGFTIDWDSTSVSKNNLATSIYIYDDAAGV